MGQLIPVRDTAERLAAIAESIPTGRSSFGDTYLSPFVEVMIRLDRQQHGIDRHDVVAVSQAYMNCEDWGWDGGFLVELTDGRRAMVDVSVDDFDWDNKTKITVELKPAGFDYLSPDVPRDHQVRMNGFVDDLPELGIFLELMAARPIEVEVLDDDTAVDFNGKVHRLPF